MAYKVIKWLIIPIFAILLMSHNANAIDLQYDLNNYDVAYNVQRPRIVFNFQNSSITGNPVNMSNTTGSLISGNFETLSWNLKAGDLITFDLVAYSSSFFTVAETVGPSSSLSNNLFFSRFVGSGFSIISVDPVNISSNFDIINYYLDLTCRTAGVSENCTGYPELTLDYHYYSVYKIIMRADRDITDFNFSFTGSTTAPVLSLLNAYNQYNVSLYFDRFIVYRPVQTKEEEAANKDLESTENIENQSPSDTPGGDNQSATNLIGNISGIFNQIANIPVGSSCSIDADFGNLDLGNLNLCTGKDKMPFIVNFGATVFQLVFVVSTGLILVRQVLSLYDWSRK